MASCMIETVLFQGREFSLTITLREKCSYLEFFWSVFSCICTEYGEILSVFSPYAAKYEPEKLLLRSLFT